MTLPIVAVVAMGRNRVIGAKDAMPWHLPSDLRHYRALTLGKPTIMGRRTLAAIGRALDGRDTIVLSRQGEIAIPGVNQVATPEAALTLAASLAAGRGAREIVVAGGAEIYRLFLDRIDRVYATLVDAEPAGDAWFPELDPAIFEMVSDEPVSRDPADSALTRRLVFERRETPAAAALVEAGDGKLC